ncbi:Prostaglandin reductase-3 [Acropora cervicornis]|uniref:15-oxoprostaglandin 13-reductase n=1 Tax=Acropora cervicornis TaxID=6130 RepID=A0AAD9QQG1_ACRCE|nr:Prostaglandin reductase-3 [Acropora cervicornis]
MAAARKLPETFRKLVITKLSTNYREAVESLTVPMLQPKPDELLLKNRYVGINATDINHSAGRYDPGKSPPLDAGLEGIAEVVLAGDNCTNFHVGQAVGYLKSGAFSEYMQSPQPSHEPPYRDNRAPITLITGEREKKKEGYWETIPSNHVLPLPRLDPAYVSLLVSGLTAGIALEKVQLAKQAGCHVIGTCSTDSKVNFLKTLGCDRPINYKTENLNEVLKKEFPKGCDVVYESIGGEMFDTCMNRLATRGRLVTIGFITGYQSKLGFPPVKHSTIVPKLLAKSASLRGFLLFHYVEEFKTALAKLVSLYDSGHLKCTLDFGQSSPSGYFKGLDSIVDAVEYLHSGKSSGKVVVELPDDSKSRL